jgi:aspartyl-tRNA(Asn)/glutamyl-tRNA(Gln) amidotransferase subunit C
MLTQEEVKKIAKLARLSLTDAEVEKFGKQLSAIIDFSKELNEVNTSKVEPIAQVTGLTNITFDDELGSCNIQEGLLGQAAMPVAGNMIKVKKVLE